LLNPDLARALMRRVPAAAAPAVDRSIASILRDQAVYGTLGTQMAPTNRASGGRVSRASGGRTTMDHEAAASRLVKMVDQVRKRQATTTKPLLKLPDETIARALSVANRAIAS
jgi:hypothetical protein